MSRERLTRIKRLVSVRERYRDSAQAALSDANRRVQHADAEHAEAECSWSERAEAAVQDLPQSVDELVDQRNHLASLRQSADHALHRRCRAAEQEDARRGEALRAQQELRKMELWSGAVAESLRADEARAEQRKTDELAADLRGRGKDDDRRTSE